MTIKEGDTFTTLQEFKDCLRRWAISENWTPHILDSDSHRVRAGCRSAPNCPFRIRANFNASKGRVLITTCDGEHTCFQTRDGDNPLHQNIKRSETGKLKFLLEEVPKLMNVTLDTHVQQIVDAVEAKFGQKIPIRQAQKVKTGLTPRVLGPCRECHQTGHTRRHCPRLRHLATERHLNYSAVESESGLTGQHTSYATPALQRNLSEQSSTLLVQPSNGSNAAPPGSSNSSSARPSVNPLPLEAGLSNGVYTSSPSQHHFPAPILQTPPSSATASAESATQTRLRASQLMQQAANLMEQAAKLNSEAAKLNASVASM